MESKKYNILVWGLLSTGSSALIDILREYDNIQIIPGEFDDFRAPGRIADQLFFTESESYIKINVLTGFKGKFSLLFQFFKKILKGKIRSQRFVGQILTIQIRLKQLALLKRLNKMLSTDISYEEKISLVRDWINDIGKIKNKNKGFVLFNQPLTPSIDTRVWKQVFFPFKFICVYRDPKDQLAEIIRKSALFAPYGAPFMNHGGLVLESIYGRSRQGAIQFHIEAIKRRMEWIDQLKTELDPDEFLLIDFEGLANNYEGYKKAVENFIGDLKPNPDKYMKYFNPSVAAENIGIYKMLLEEDDLQKLKPLEKWYYNKLNSHLIHLETLKV